mgnify:CR=1 FL=1
MTSFKDISDIEKIAQDQFCKVLERELGFKVEGFQFSVTSEDLPMIDFYGLNRGFTTKRSVELSIDDGLFQHVITGKDAEKYYRRCLDILGECATVFRNPPPLVFHSLL